MGILFTGMNISTQITQEAMSKSHSLFEKKFECAYCLIKNSPNPSLILLLC